MIAFFTKVKKKIVFLQANFKKDRLFSLNFATYGLLSSLFNQLKLKKMEKRYSNKRNEWINSFLSCSIAATYEQFKYSNDLGIYDDNHYVWVCWWSGYKTAPDLVKKCINSIKRHTQDCVFVFIDETNYTNYIDIPDYIIDKVNDGRMCLANFSDYLRVSLIEKYGGLWIDSTIFMVKDIPLDYFNYPFFTCRNEYRDVGYISMFRWTSFFIGGWKNNIFFKYMKSAFEEYWKFNDCSIDYLLVDYLINYAYNNITSIRELIDDVPINNDKKDELQAAFNNRSSSLSFNEYLNNIDTYFYKLSWREEYKRTTIEGAESIYGYFMNNY
jgi:hypothetical protein